MLLGDGYMERQGVGSHTVKSRSNEMPVYDCWGGREGWCVLGMERGRACYNAKIWSAILIHICIFVVYRNKEPRNKKPYKTKALSQ